MSRESVYTFCDPMSLRSFGVGDLINNHEGPGEIITRVDAERLRIFAVKATRWQAFKYRAIQWKRGAWWRIKCAYYDLKDRF